MPKAIWPPCLIERVPALRTNVSLPLRVSLFSLVLVTLAACYVPPVWDIGDAVNSVDEIEEGKTTRAEVLDLLGEPDSGNVDSSIYQYSGKHSDGFYLLVIPSPGGIAGGGGGLIDEDLWLVTIYFDEKDVVQAACTSEDDADERQVCDRKVAQLRERDLRELREEFSVARLGATREQVEDVLGKPNEIVDDAMVHVYRHQRASANDVRYVTYGPDGTVTRAETAAQRHEERMRLVAEKLLARAQCGDTDAQFAVGSQYRSGRGSFPRDQIEAVRWLELASRQGHETAAVRLKQVRKDMAPEQISEGERLMADWEPKDCTAKEVASPSD